MVINIYLALLGMFLCLIIGASIGITAMFTLLALWFNYKLVRKSEQEKQ